MPTNPLWLEHTERAAWDTVQALREQIQAERARVEQLLRSQQQWPKLLEALNEVAKEHGITERDPAAIVGALASELTRVKLKPKVVAAPEPTTEPGADTFDPAAHTGPSSPATTSAPSSALAQFLDVVRGVELRDANRKKRSLDALLDVLEAKLDELEHAPRFERVEHAAELAYVAFLVAHARSR